MFISMCVRTCVWRRVRVGGDSLVYDCAIALHIEMTKIMTVHMVQS